MSPVQQIGSIDHLRHGTYYIYWNCNNGCYGISRKAADLTTHCGYVSLAALFAMKGL
jgi:hypothetical protein